MINRNKKGFTIVELVIVIAVIAILAAVLIPTFAGIIKKANLSADQQAVRQMNVALAAEFATETPEDLKQVVDVLDSEGYNVGSLTPLTKNHTFYWCEGTKIIVLVEGENTVVYPTDASFDVAKAHNLSDGASFINVKATTSEAAAEALANGSDLTLEADVVLVDTVDINGDVTVDLNGHVLDASDNGGRLFNIKDGATLTINAEGATIKCGAYGLFNIDPTVANATIVVNGGTFTADLDNGAFIKARGNGTINITLNNVNYADTSDDSYIMNTQAAKGSTITLAVNGGTFDAAFGFQAGDVYQIDGAKITTDGFAIEAQGNSTITNCTITSGTTYEGDKVSGGAIPAIAVVAANRENCNVVVKDCTINAGKYVYGTLGENAKLTATGNTLSGATENYNNGGTLTIN